MIYSTERKNSLMPFLDKAAGSGNPFLQFVTVFRKLYMPFIVYISVINTLRGV